MSTALLNTPQGQHRGSAVGHQGIASPPTRARGRHAVERGHVAQRQPNQAGGSQNTGGTAEAVQPVFNRTLPQALPEASLGASPSQLTDIYKAIKYNQRVD
jgi:hypothetical protein